MSVWTHVAGLIRYDDIRQLGTGLRPHYEKALGATWDPGDPRSRMDACNVPEGSEGSLQWELQANPNEHSAAAYTVRVWGDLRDYDDLDEIGKWFDRCIKGEHFMVRQAVLHAEVERQGGRLWWVTPEGQIVTQNLKAP